MEESDRYTKSGFQVNDEANETNESSSPPQYYPLTFIPPQKEPTCHLGFQQGIDREVEEPLNQQGQALVIVSGYGGNGLRRKQRTYLYFSICNLLCCFWPIGLWALRYSLKSRRCADRNDPEGAARHGSTALKWNICGLVIGIILEIALAVYYFYRIRHDKDFASLFENE